MAREPNEILEQQRRQRMEQQQATRGTMETVNLEQRQAQEAGPMSKVQQFALYILAAIGGIWVIVQIFDLLFG